MDYERKQSFFSKGGSGYDPSPPHQGKDMYRHMDPLNNDDIFACADYEEQVDNQYKNNSHLGRISQFSGPGRDIKVANSKKYSYHEGGINTSGFLKSQSSGVFPQGKIGSGVSDVNHFQKPKPLDNFKSISNPRYNNASKSPSSFINGDEDMNVMLSPRQVIGPHQTVRATGAGSKF